MGIASFKDRLSEDICHGRFSKATQRRLPVELQTKALIKLARLAAATSLSDLTDLRGNRLEMLKGNRTGQYSIRINDQYRICFHWHQNDAYDVEVTDYH
ncbi:MAG TPA: type II toxin-antitoxin system RelE/ParE family toxin [Pyrinomonadaceae bacterium]|nr:type II toxin-antitoxin system RelE/ParE family toxin [Pyrinomonadaceae bacterium]